MIYQYKDKNVKFINEFSKINISEICRNLNVCRPAILQGSATPDKIALVREELEKKIGKLFITETDDTNGTD